MTDQTTRETTEVRTAGRELDALVAEKVMGWKRYGRRNSGTWTAPGGFNASAGSWPTYSTDIAAAWEVVEAMQKKAWVTEVSADCFVDGRPAGFTAHCWYDDDSRHYATADTAPLAICRAALQAMEARHG